MHKKDRKKEKKNERDEWKYIKLYILSNFLISLSGKLFEVDSSYKLHTVLESL